ncbi:MAG: DUF1835 domain-containing protein [Cytophagales bacterium]|nr:DUF1835 domain-containing protein [Cytophagales bacterium]
MRKQIHILNGDSLKIQIPSTIQGDFIICRECLVEGDIQGENLEELFTNRISFLKENYDVSKSEYEEKVITEFHKIIEIENSEINLWFEEDLFCQVNFWFITHILNKKHKNNSVFLVKPKSHSKYNFGKLTKFEIIDIYKHKVPLEKLDDFANLWKEYQMNNLENMLSIANKLNHNYSFILPVVKAHRDRMGNSNRPINSLKKIIKELNTEDFEIIFDEFSKRESIYGLGDLQVKRLYEQIKT